jgi:septum formation protein
VVLASTSAGRRHLLDRLGLEPLCVAPEVDEDAFKALSSDPAELARNLAREKALVVSRRGDASDVVIGGDQLVALDDQILGKPGTAQRAVEQLLAMSGRSHRLVTAVAVVHREEVREHVDITTLHMRELTRGELERYVQADFPLDCAGAYRIERRGIALFDRIESQDHTAIVGLPLIWLTGTLRELGVALP